MGFKIFKIGVLSFLTTTFLMFQNCSEAEFSTIKTAEKMSLGEGEKRQTDVPLDKELTEEEIDEKEKDLEKAEMVDCLLRPAIHSVDNGGQDLSLTSVAGIGLYENIGHLELNGSNGIFRFSEVKSAKLQRSMGINIVEAQKVESISDTLGINCVAAASFGEAKNLHGIQVLVGPDQSQAAFSSIENARGIILLKNVVLDKLKNFRGIVVLDNASIANVESVNGIIRDRKTRVAKTIRP